MTTQTQESQLQNPFRAQRNYSNAAIELMRALAVKRRATGLDNSTPRELIDVLAHLGYRQPVQSTLPREIETQRFTRALTQFQQDNDVAYPTCEDVLSVLDQIGYCCLVDDMESVIDFLPIDRRRREMDARVSQSERRTSLEPSVQEQLDLTDEEHGFLDAMKVLRLSTGREFAASEELLSIAWDLGYRPVDADGVQMAEFTDEDRCKLQMAFTRAVEASLATAQDKELLTCRTIFEILQSIGFQQTN